MKVYDYSNLLTVINNLDMEKAILINKQEMNKKNELIKLERQLLESKMLEDWKGLNEALRKAKVRGCPYPKRIGIHAEFSDNYTFDYRVYSCSYDSVYYCLSEKNTTDEIIYCERFITGSARHRMITSETEKVRVKTILIKEFMQYYPEYREIKLKELYEKIGIKAEEVEKMKNIL